VSGWFEGPAPAGSQATEFLRALAVDAVRGLLADAQPGDTSRTTLPSGYRDGVVVGLVLPGVTCRRRLLRVSFESGDEHRRPVLQSDWAEEMSESSPPGAYEWNDAETNLWVSGVVADPATFARWVGEWFAQQLARPVVRREWDRLGTRGAGRADVRRAVVVEWRLGEPDQLLDDRGTFGRWGLMRQPPAREVHERGPDVRST
jgi:hypothetical protein